MKEKIIKLISKLLIVFFVLVLAFSPNLAYAESDTTSLSSSEIISSGKEFINHGQNPSGGQKKPELSSMWDIVRPIGGVLLGIATIVFFVVGVMLGLQLMMANDQKKAQVKQKMIWYVVAIVLTYGATGITALVLRIIGIE